MSYPDPCLTCEKNNACDSCGRYRHCEKWKTRYRYRQRQINAYAKKVLPAYYAQQKGAANNG